MFLDATTAVGIVFSILCILLPIIVLAVFIPYKIIQSKYTSFVKAHSVAIKELNDINLNYKFREVTNLVLEQSYDTESMYRDLLPSDYLVHYLSYNHKAVSNQLNDSLYNKNLYEDYINRVNEIKGFGIFDIEETPKNQKRLEKRDEKLFKSQIQKPNRFFSIKVTLILTNIEKKPLTRKSMSFDAKYIKDIINRLKNRRGYFYLDNEIWNSITKAERAKVSNRMRFAIYKRDNNRCRMCGRSTGDLEIDHIIPIAKGGKSTYDNLQTLCKRCNQAKGSKIL